MGTATPEQIEQFERDIERRAKTMNIEQLEEALVKLPASPPMSDEQFLTRIAFTRRRIELIEAAKPDPRAPKPIHPALLIDVIDPATGGTLQMTWPDFWGRCFQWVNGVVRPQISTTGPSGGEWLAANPQFADRFPQADRPPPPQPFQE
jgi:hypothetical protein